MNDFLPEMFNRTTLAGSGGGLLLVGALIWNLPGIYKNTFAARRDFAARLREAGEVERAARVDAETAMLLRRGPIYGKVLVVTGFASILVGLFIGR